jgi:hypothetical protein
VSEFEFEIPKKKNGFDNEQFVLEINAGHCCSSNLDCCHWWHYLLPASDLLLLVKISSCDNCGWNCFSGLKKEKEAISQEEAKL